MLTTRGGSSGRAPGSSEPARPVDGGRWLIEVQETERRRIARDLHDVVGQALTAVRLSVLAVRGGDEAWPVRQQRLDEALATVDLALTAVRTCAIDLRPAVLDDRGLDAAVGWYLARLGRDAGFHTALISDPSLDRLDPVLETSCFRLIQEALTNVVRHAAARHVSVVLNRTPRHVHVTVRDDGIGFDVGAVLSRREPADRLGLAGMQERVGMLGGTLRIRSTTGRGTVIRASIPLTLRRPRAHDGEAAS